MQPPCTAAINISLTSPTPPLTLVHVSLLLLLTPTIAIAIALNVQAAPHPQTFFAHCSALQPALFKGPASLFSPSAYPAPPYPECPFPPLSHTHPYFFHTRRVFLRPLSHCRVAEHLRPPCTRVSGKDISSRRRSWITAWFP